MRAAPPAPMVTAVVLADAGPAAVERLLAGLRRGRCGDPRTLEILVVAGPSRRRRERLARVCAGAGARLLRGQAPAAAARRGAGLRAAAARVVLFAAADGGPGDGLVEAHLRHWEGAPPGLGAVAGPVLFAGGRALEAAGEAGLVVGFRPARIVPGLDWCAADNLSVDRDLALRAGGFDGDDGVGLCVRLGQAGHRVEECPDAVLRRRAGWRSAGATVAACWRWGRMTRVLAARRAIPAGPHGPGLVPCALGLLGLCALAAVRWRQPAALAVWAASLPAFTLLASLAGSRDPASFARLVAGRALAAAYELGHLADGLRHGEAAALWSRPLPAAPGRQAYLAGRARDWVVMAAVAGAALLALAVVR